MEPSNESILCDPMELEKPQEIVRFSSSLKEERSHPLVSLRVSSYLDFSNYEPAILLDSELVQRQKISIKQPSSFFLDLQNSKTKVVKSPKMNDQYIIENRKIGYRLLGSVSQYFGIREKAVFDIQCPKIKEKDIERGQILKSTFVNLREQTFNSMILRSDDIIKLGRELFQLTIVDDTISPNLRWFRQMKYQEKLEQGYCRICLSEQTTQNNFFISPCACIGSCGYIHMQCMREWLQTRIVQYKNDKLIGYNLKIFHCQLCKTDLPKFLNVAGKLVQLFPMVVKHEKFCMLENIGDKNAMAYVVPFKENEKIQIKIGRCQENDLILNDMSISRRHAILSIFPGGDIEISDFRSKFGTFVQFRRKISNCKRIVLVNNKYTFDFSIDPQ